MVRQERHVQIPHDVPPSLLAVRGNPVYNLITGFSPSSTRTHEVLFQKMASLGQGSNPCMVLNSYHSGCKYELKSEKGPAHAKEFVMAVDVLGREYVGKGRSKKLAKQAAAANALNEMYNVRLTLGAQGPGMITINRPCTVAKPGVDS